MFAKKQSLASVNNFPRKKRDWDQDAGQCGRPNKLCAMELDSVPEDPKSEFRIAKRPPLQRAQTLSLLQPSSIGLPVEVVPILPFVPSKDNLRQISPETVLHSLSLKFECVN